MIWGEGEVGGEGSDSFPSLVFEDQQREAARHRFDLNALCDCKFMLNHRLVSVSRSRLLFFLLSFFLFKWHVVEKATTGQQSVVVNKP